MTSLDLKEVLSLLDKAVDRMAQHSGERDLPILRLYTRMTRLQADLAVLYKMLERKENK